VSLLNFRLQALRDLELLFDDGDEYVDAHGAPDLGLGGVFGDAEKGFDAQVLLDPFEEEFDLPASFVELGDAECGEGKVVGDEDVLLVSFEVAVDDSAHGFGVIVLQINACQDNGLVAQYSRAFVDGIRVASLKFEVGFGACDEES
jgi:hypothetical protein